MSDPKPYTMNECPVWHGTVASVHLGRVRATVEALEQERVEYAAEAQRHDETKAALLEAQRERDALVRERDEARADYERARADFLRCAETQRAAFADAATDADLLRAEAARLREALEVIQRDFHAAHCMRTADGYFTSHHPSCDSAREALKGGGAVSCNHEGIGEPGCYVCDPDKGRVISALRAEVEALEAEMKRITAYLKEPCMFSEPCDLCRTKAKVLAVVNARGEVRR